MLTPITIARGSLDVLRQSGAWSREETEESHDIVAGELSRMTRLLQRLLLLERAAAPDHVALVPDRCRRAARRGACALGARRRRRARAHHGRGRRAPLDRDEIVLALDALLENAVQHSQPGGRIELRSACATATS